MKIVVIGGTGLIGAKAVRTLGRHGHEAVAGAGLAEQCLLPGPKATVFATTSAACSPKTLLPQSDNSGDRR